MPLVISIAGSDPGRGAGLQMDERACRRLGVDFVGICALDTVQDDGGLQSVHPVEVDEIVAQLHGVLNERSAAVAGSVAVKTGALGNANLVNAIADVLSKHSTIPVVVDPVRVASRSTGAELLSQDGWHAMQNNLFPIATLVTPNTHEYGDGLSYSNCNAVLIKGGHAAADVVEDEFWQAGKFVFKTKQKRLAGGTELHGTGCALSASIAAHLAQSYDLISSVKSASDFIHRWIGEALQLKQDRNLETVDLLADGKWRPLS